ncbi:MAG: prenyltransferase [Candidatus Syntrophoarchaeum sp. GoM_oil]|nr:MAG: prenyltransferase [Candidatus Syntrophoarchaeum sp. GoM_oil]
MADIEDVHVKNRFGKTGHLFNHSLSRRLKDLYLLLDKFFSLLIISSVFIGITGFLLPYFSFLLYEINVNYNLLLASFLLTFAVYNLDKVTGIEEDSINVPERAGFIEKNKQVIIFAVVIAYITAFALSFLQSHFAIFIILFPFCTGIVYSIKISNFRLKDVTGIKNITVALSWAVIGTFLPLTVSDLPPILTILIFYFSFSKLFVNTVLFDVRDIEGDRINNVRTIPVVFGLNNTRRLLLILNSTLVPWLFYSYSSGFFHHYIPVLIFGIIYGYWYIVHFCKEGLKIGKSLDLLVDGEWIPIALLCFLSKVLAA